MEEMPMMKTVVRFLTSADETITRGRNFKHFGAAEADKITVHEIQVSERCVKYFRLISRQQVTRSGSRSGKVYLRSFSTVWLRTSTAWWVSSKPATWWTTTRGTT